MRRHVFYQQVGEVPPKRHTQFRRPDGALYTEELIGNEGFSGLASLLYHYHPPVRVTDIRPARSKRPRNGASRCSATIT